MDVLKPDSQSVDSLTLNETSFSFEMNTPSSMKESNVSTFSFKDDTTSVNKHEIDDTRSPPQSSSPSKGFSPTPTTQPISFRSIPGSPVLKRLNATSRYSPKEGRKISGESHASTTVSYVL